MVVDTSTELTSEKLHEMGEEKVKIFNEKWGVSAEPSMVQERVKSKTEWWENNIKNHISEGLEIKSPVLRSLYQEYLDEYYGVKDESDLRKIFLKDMNRFTGTEEDEKKAFDGYLFNNFSDWMTGSVPAAIAEVRNELEEGKPETELGEKNRLEKEKGDRVDLKINWDEVRSLHPPSLKGEFHEFLNIWNSRRAVEVSMAVENGAITHIGLIGDGGKQASLPIGNFIDVFDGLKSFKDTASGRTGFMFSESGEFVYPGTEPNLVKRVICKIAIDNKKLNNDFWVNMGDFNKDKTRKI